MVKDLQRQNASLKLLLAIVAVILIIVVIFVLFLSHNDSSAQSFNHQTSIPQTSAPQINNRKIIVTAVDLYAHDLSTGQTYAFGTDKGGNITNSSTGFFTFPISCSGGGTESIDSFQLSPPSFILTNVTPALPVMLPCNNVTTTFNLDFTVPNKSYTGILTVTENYNDYSG